MSRSIGAASPIRESSQCLTVEIHGAELVRDAVPNRRLSICAIALGPAVVGSAANVLVAAASQVGAGQSVTADADHVRLAVADRGGRGSCTRGRTG